MSSENNRNNHNGYDEQPKKTFRVTISDEDYAAESNYYDNQPQRRSSEYGGQGGAYRQPSGGAYRQNPNGGAYRQNPNGRYGYNGGQSRSPVRNDQPTVRSQVPAQARRTDDSAMRQYYDTVPQVTRTRTVTTRTGERFEIPEETAIPPRIMRKNSKNTKSRGCVIALVYAAIVCSISAILSFYIIVGLNDMFGLVKEEAEIVVEIHKDATLDEVTQILDENGIVDYPFFFKLYADFTNDTSFKAGTFVLNTKSDYDQIIRKLTRPATADKSIVTVTITEGLTMEEIGQLLEDYCVCEKAAFLYSVQNADFSSYSFVSKIPVTEDRIYRLEGYLFPDTYDFYIWEGSQSAIKRLLSNYQTKVLENEELDINARAKALGVSVDDIMKMASVIEREVPTIEDMKIVSSVFYNRIKNPSKQGTGGMLQSDATRWYPYATGKDIRESEDLTEAEKNSWIADHNGVYVRIITNPYTDEETRTVFNTSKYDTYVVKGLPAGPICCPGLNAITAACYPSKTSYYFFYSASDGTTYYAETYDEHLNNISRYG